MKSNHIRSLPLDDRPYEKLSLIGAQKLSDCELLAIVLKNGSNGVNALELSREILTDENIGPGLIGLENASIEELKAFKGIGHVKAIQIKAVVELSRRIGNRQRGIKPKFVLPLEIAEYMQKKAVGLQREVCWVLCFDPRMKLIKDTEISVGTVDSAIVHPREIFHEAVKACAHTVVVVHNHPSGDCTPSENDIKLTERLKKAGLLMGIELRDHIIISDSNYFSFLNKSML
ncbi:MAG: DNA repair protein RadC [Clostridia bacterium]